jgi:hypothetical protein
MFISSPYQVYIFYPRNQYSENFVNVSKATFSSNVSRSLTITAKESHRSNSQRSYLTDKTLDVNDVAVIDITETKAKGQEY